MKVTFFTTSCPKCGILKSLLKAKGIEYETVTDRQKMIDLGMTTVPGLMVDDVMMTFVEGVDWVNKQEGN